MMTRASADESRELDRTLPPELRGPLPLYRLESYAPISGKWFQSGPDSTSFEVLRREADESHKAFAAVSLRIVGPDGEVIQVWPAR